MKNYLWRLKQFVSRSQLSTELERKRRVVYLKKKNSNQPLLEIGKEIVRVVARGDKPYLRKPADCNRPFAQLLVWVRDGASSDGLSITCTWIAPSTAGNGDKKSTSRPSETLKLHVGDWPTVTGCPVSNPGNNCANGLFTNQESICSAQRTDLCFVICKLYQVRSINLQSWGSTRQCPWPSSLHTLCSRLAIMCWC